MVTRPPTSMQVQVITEWSNRLFGAGTVFFDATGLTPDRLTRNTASETIRILNGLPGAVRREARVSPDVLRPHFAHLMEGTTMNDPTPPLVRSKPGRHPCGPDRVGPGEGQSRASTSTGTEAARQDDTAHGADVPGGAGGAPLEDAGRFAQKLSTLMRGTNHRRVVQAVGFRVAATTTS